MVNPLAVRFRVYSYKMIDLVELDLHEPGIFVLLDFTTDYHGHG